MITEYSIKDCPFGSTRRSFFPIKHSDDAQYPELLSDHLVLEQ